eukprot:TRINITY_DN3111_c0_g1_i1.p1 TRINITY_DN3111_c0_g1~~TRINITY_DN3111_c0_g1_i1.p1  ORF type:complete len:313 (-),score=34.36 TRINITY_DN3111_c0_g1_i1:884-1822(-)
MELERTNERDDSVLGLLEQQAQRRARVESESDSDSDSTFVPLDLPIPANNNNNLNDFDATQTNPRPSCFWFSVYLTYCLLVTTAILVVLLVDRDKPCDTPLRLWAIVQCIILLIGMVLRICTTFNQCVRGGRHDDSMSFLFRLQERWFIFLQRSCNMTFFVWFLLGMVWTFRSKTCVSTSPALYILSIILISINISVFTLTVLCCTFGLLFFSLIAWCFPYLFSETIPGADLKVISSLPTKKYSVGLLQDLEDAKYSICHLLTTLLLPPLLLSSPYPLWGKLQLALEVPCLNLAEEVREKKELTIIFVSWNL